MNLYFVSPILIRDLKFLYALKLLDIPLCLLFALLFNCCMSFLEVECHFHTNFCRYANSSHVRETSPRSVFQVHFCVDPGSGFKRLDFTKVFEGKSLNHFSAQSPNSFSFRKYLSAVCGENDRKCFQFKSHLLHLCICRDYCMVISKSRKKRFKNNLKCIKNIS